MVLFFRTCGTVIIVSAGMQRPPATGLPISPSVLGPPPQWWWGNQRRAQLIGLHKSFCELCEICLYRAIMREGSEGFSKRISSSLLLVCRESFHCPVRKEWGQRPGFRVQLQLDEKQCCFPWPHFKSIVTAATSCFLPVRSPWFLPSPQHFPLCSGKLLWRADRLPWASQSCEEKTRQFPGNTWFISTYPAKVISPKCWPKATSGRQLHCCYNWAYLIPSDQYLIYHHSSSALKYWT